MPTQKTRMKIEIIKVTEDVYDAGTALEHFKQEQRAGLYHPLIHIHLKELKGKNVKTYCIARLPEGADDIAFIESARTMARRNGREEWSVAAVPAKELFTIKRNQFTQAEIN
jgi:hypothetical protein